MNKNTRSLRREGFVGINNGPEWAVRRLEVFKGATCHTGFDKKSAANKRKSAWRGAGNPLGR